MLDGINGNYNYYRTSPLLQEKAEEEQVSGQVLKEDSKVNDSKNTYREISVPEDKYINSSEEDIKATGLYYLGKDENGNKKIFFNNPEKPENQKQPDKNKNMANGAKPDDRERTTEKCTGNTDSVDREIEKLKEKKKQLEKQIKEASGNEEKVKKLEMELAQIESELSQKDNNTYRRSHSSFISEA